MVLESFNSGLNHHGMFNIHVLWQSTLFVGMFLVSLSIHVLLDLEKMDFLKDNKSRPNAKETPCSSILDLYSSKSPRTIKA